MTSKEDTAYKNPFVVTNKFRTNQTQPARAVIDFKIFEENEEAPRVYNFAPANSEARVTADQNTQQMNADSKSDV